MVRPRYFARLSHELGIHLWVQEEYLLPFPFAGNKWVKLKGQLGAGISRAAYISNGGVSSNHCRTLAVWSAYHGHRCHLVLHNDAGSDDSLPLEFLQRFGATYSVVDSTKIAETIGIVEKDLNDQGYTSIVVPGGGHSVEAIRAYASYAAESLKDTDFDVIFHASGTGGTQAGLCIASAKIDSQVKVIGISVARTAERGTSVIQDSIREASKLELEVDFRDGYIDGGYGPGGPRTNEAVQIAGHGGLVLDETYTGKAFAGLIDAVNSGEIPPHSKVLFWHTGGLYLAANPNS